MRRLRSLYEKNPWKFVILAWVLYVVSFFLIENFNRDPVIYLHSRIDDLIPFSRFAIIPYAGWFPLLVIPMGKRMVKQEYDQVWDLLVPMFIAMFGSLIFYLIVPNGLHLRPAQVEGNDLCAWLVRSIQSMDTPENVCPSIHVSTTVLIDMFLQKQHKGETGMCIFLHALAIAICLSTMFLKQHSFVDVFWGLAAALVIRYFMDRSSKGKAA